MIHWYFASVQWTPSGQPQAGEHVSWLELLVDFAICTGFWGSGCARQLESSKSYVSAVLSFRKACIRVVGCAGLDLAAMEVRAYSLRRLGFVRHRCMGFGARPCMLGGEATTQAIIAIHGYCHSAAAQKRADQYCSLKWPIEACHWSSRVNIQWSDTWLEHVRNAHSQGRDADCRDRGTRVRQPAQKARRVS